MDSRDRSESPGIRALALRTLKLAWLPIAVFVAIELAVPSRLSILQLVSGSQDQQEAPPGTDTTSEVRVLATHNASVAQDSLHSYFGIDKTTANEDNRPARPNGEPVTKALGNWSGRFAGVLAGDLEASCWSEYSFDLVLNETGSQVSGTGSYWVDPASCSLHTDRFVAFVDARGTLSENRVHVEFLGSGNETTELVFEGLLMRDRLTGWFYSPEGKAVSGPVTLRRK